MSADVFTPLDGKNASIRLTFPRDSVRVVKGDLSARKKGLKAFVLIQNKLYAVHGIACGLPNCNCDAYIEEVDG